MKAALCRTLDGPDAISLEDLPAPDPGPGEVAVRVRAAGLNFLDTLITRGKYQYRPELPFSPAAEIAGEVHAVGAGVTEFRPGDRICAYIGWGGGREIAIANAAALVRIPDAIDYATAAGLNVTYGTAMHGLIDRGRLQKGEIVAVLGASGGAGLAAVEVADQLGARVIAIASSSEKLDVCLNHGAACLLNYTEVDLKQGLRDITGGHGADVIYDCVGGVHAEQALRSVAWMGRFLVVGFAAGEIPRIPLNLVLLKCCDIAGVFWSEFAVREPGKQAANIARVLDWIAQGRLRPHVHARMPLADIGKAIKLLDERKVRGKVIIEIS